MKKSSLVLIIFSLLTACGAADSDAGPGGISAEDARSLDEAAARLDAQNNENSKSRSQQ